MSIRKIILMSLASLGFAGFAFAQTLLPARQVSVHSTPWLNIAPTAVTAQASFDWIDANWPAFDSSGWTNINPATDTVASVFSWIDANWQPVLATNGWHFLMPTSATAQATFNWLDDYAGTNGLMRGTNIYSFTFDPTNKTWYPPADLVGVENLSFLSDTNLAANDPWGVEIATNGFWDTNSLAWTTNSSGTNTVAFISHPPFIVGDDVQFPSFVTKEEFYGILNSMGFANVFGFTATTDSDTYGSKTNVLANDDYQLWTVPANLIATNESVTDNQAISVYCWGAGGGDPLYGVGGYSAGTFYLTSNTTDDATMNANPSLVKTGMVLCVQVGAYSGRAAVWRHDTNLNYSSLLDPIIVAGGAGGPDSIAATSYPATGNGGGATGLSGAGPGGAPGTQTAGGAGYGGAPAGTNVWGGYYAGALYGGVGANGKGGDGYFGGGSGVSSGVGRQGGGGSGFVAPGLSNGVTESASSAWVPPGTTNNVAYDANAGYPRSPGRVAFEIRFADWSN